MLFLSFPAEVNLWCLYQGEPQNKYVYFRLISCWNLVRLLLLLLSLSLLLALFLLMVLFDDVILLWWWHLYLIVDLSCQSLQFFIWVCLKIDYPQTWWFFILLATELAIFGVSPLVGQLDNHQLVGWIRKKHAVYCSVLLKNILFDVVECSTGDEFSSHFVATNLNKKIVAVQRPLLPNLEHFYNPIPDDFPAYQRVRYGKIHHFPGFSQIFPYFSIFVNRILPFLSHIFRPRFPLPLSPSRHLRRHQDWRSGGAGTAVRDCAKLMVNKRQ